MVDVMLYTLIAKDYNNKLMLVKLLTFLTIFLYFNNFKISFFTNAPELTVCFIFFLMIELSDAISLSFIVFMGLVIDIIQGNPLYMTGVLFAMFYLMVSYKIHIFANRNFVLMFAAFAVFYFLLTAFKYVIYYYAYDKSVSIMALLLIYCKTLIFYTISHYLLNKLLKMLNLKTRSI